MEQSHVFAAESVPFVDVEWGRTKVLAGLGPSGGGKPCEAVEFKVTEFLPGYSHRLHVHATQVEILYVLSGRGVHEDTEGRRVGFGPGDVVFIPAGCWHANHNPHSDPLRVLVVKVPPGRSEMNAAPSLLERPGLT